MTFAMGTLQPPRPHRDMDDEAEAGRLDSVTLNLQRCFTQLSVVAAFDESSSVYFVVVAVNLVGLMASKGSWWRVTLTAHVHTVICWLVHWRGREQKTVTFIVNGRCAVLEKGK